MSDKNNLRRYLMKHFLVAVFFVGIAELALNFLFRVFAYPALDHFFGLQQVWEDVDLSQALMLVVQSIFVFLINRLIVFFPGVLSQYLETQFASQMEGSIFHYLQNYLSDYTPLEARLMTTVFVLFLVFLLLVWLLPYILAAASFGATVSRKVAELEATEQEKQAAYERQRNLLLSDVAHDLKTPMTTVVGYAHALLHEDVTNPDQQREYLEAIHRKSIQMNELIRLLFEYVKLDSAGFALKLEDVDAVECVRETVAAMYADFEDDGISLAVNIPEERVELQLDVLQFTRALTNLFVNARKHNPRGTTVGVEMTEMGQEVELRVWDSGVAIAQEIATHLFDPFVQGDASRRSKSGSGLGLSITKKIIEMHGGEVTFEQNNLPPGKTKEFIVILPKKREYQAMLSAKDR